MKARLKNRFEDDNLIVAEFEAADLEFVFRPGEYVQIVLPNHEKRYFSVFSSPSALPIFHIGTRPSSSLFKRALAEMHVGTEVDVNGPWGDVVLPEDVKEKSFYFIAGGIGVTPFVSMLQYKSEEQLPYDVSLLYFYSDSVPPFKMELESAAAGSIKSRVLFIKHHVSAGIIKNALTLDYLLAGYYVAGPPGFVNKAQNALRYLKIPQQNVIVESYTGYTN